MQACLGLSRAVQAYQHFMGRGGPLSKGKDGPATGDAAGTTTGADFTPSELPGAPHRVQNFLPSPSSAPHFLQKAMGFDLRLH